MVLLTNSAPMAKCRVLYIGSSVPLETCSGLDAIQQPLRERYPADNESSIEGIDTVVSVNSSHIQLQYVSDTDQVIQFPVSSLTMCAAVRCINTVNGSTGEKVPKFVSLNDPLAGGENAKRPAIFTAITRRTQGRKVLECHGFICSSPADALMLVKSASLAGRNYKENGTIKASVPRRVSQESTNTSILEPNQAFNRNSVNSSAFVRTSTLPKSTTSDGVQNGQAMRLIPGEPIAHNVAPGPEFFEPVSTQGYFYSGDQAEVKKYNIARLGGRSENKENLETPIPPPTEQHLPSQRPTNGYTVPSGPTSARAQPQPPIYVRMPREQYYSRSHLPPQPMPMFHVPPPMYARPRFFSPPPPRFRPQPYMMPPGGPPPRFAPPIYIRRPAPPRSMSRSRSNSSAGSRSRSPKLPENNETDAKRIPNGDADTSSDDEIRQRPSTPPKDYTNMKGGNRMSRRDVYEVRYRMESPSRGSPQRIPTGRHPPPFTNDYYVYPPRHGGYQPFAMYNPHGRARSLPPHAHRSKSPHKKGKKNKRAKKNKHRKPKKDLAYTRYAPAQSDVSTDSFAGYHSEVPLKQRPSDPTNRDYTIYPPRDFRRNENQFMNERHFSKSIVEETRRSRDSRAYPTAYELNESMNKRATNREDPIEPDFTLY